LLEEELEVVRREVTDLQHRLGKVEDQREALEDGALAVFHVVEVQAPMRVDQLHALPEIIRSLVRLGILHGAAATLASVRLHTGVHLGGINPDFPETSSTAVRRGAMRDFAGMGGSSRRRWTSTTSGDAARTRSWTARRGPAGWWWSVGPTGGQSFCFV
jgi:hypothetical protein